MRYLMSALALYLAGSASPAAVSAGERVRLAQGPVCGWYVILGCSRTSSGAFATLNRLGGPGVGGGAGTNVVNTNHYPNFRDGWYCVADGPYGSRAEAASIAWKEAVPDAYVKNGC
jgi:hypothetical protein